ncbi:MAG: hypothetical protein FJ033_05405 [Chloroflexi bacterium]|nr:hypothetical protein [Chloroflexota bacterium]
MNGVGDQLWQVIVDRAAITGATLWIITAIATGLWASEIKKRRFWLWFCLSLIGGPVTWYLLAVRLGIAVPEELRVTCPRCSASTRSDLPRCVRCRRLRDTAERDRAADLGRQAATMVFTARRLFGATRRAADAAARRREQPKRET